MTEILTARAELHRWSQIGDVVPADLTGVPGHGTDDAGEDPRPLDIAVGVAQSRPDRGRADHQ